MDMVDSLSDEGVKSEEYRVWKEETLAKQTSHKEAEQRTGLWQQFKEVGVKEKDKNGYVVEIAEGCRYICLAHTLQKVINIVGLTALRLAFFMGYE